MNDKIKTFQLPTFDEWCEHQKSYKANIGIFTCTVETFSWGPHSTTFMLAIAPCPVPSNIYAEQIIRRAYECDWSEIDAADKLKQWYESLQPMLDDRWTEYVQKTFLTEKDL